MDLGIAGKLALVTGGSTGIGYAAAHSLAAEGARVVIVARSQDTVENAAKLIAHDTGAEVNAVTGDLGSAGGVGELVTTLRQGYGRPEILVLNAGGPPKGVPSKLEDEDWATGVELTLMAPVRITRAFLPDMRENRWGRIINVTSLAVREPILNLTLSNAYRAGVTAFAKTLSNEVAADGVTVNNVGPGYTATEQLKNRLSDDAMAGLLETIPAGRLGKPQEVAAAVTFLASEQAAYVTGQTVIVDGGCTKATF
ncbi:MAG: SDR family oxidoreductase [Trueperaceae bacterium]